MKEKKKRLCSFCTKSHNDVKTLIAGPDLRRGAVFICDECTRVCADIVNERLTPPQRKVEFLDDAGVPRFSAETIGRLYGQNDVHKYIGLTHASLGRVSVALLGLTEPGVFAPPDKPTGMVADLANIIVRVIHISWIVGCSDDLYAAIAERIEWEASVFNRTNEGVAG